MGHKLIDINIALEIEVHSKWSENSAHAKAVELSNCNREKLIYITFHRNKKVYYIRNFKPKMYKQILIATYKNGIEIK